MRERTGECSYNGPCEYRETTEHRTQLFGQPLKWTSELPTQEGWYWWRQRKEQNDPFYWTTYYFVHGDSDDECNGFWSDGTSVKPPQGGQWAGPVAAPKESD